MRAAYAINAWDLLQSRRQGFHPEMPVHVALVPGPFPSPVLYVRPDMPESLDWRMLVDLDVHVLADRSAPLSRVVGTVVAIAHVKPKQLYLRFDDADRIHDIDVGQGRHFFPPAGSNAPAVHDFLWAPLNVAFTKTGARLKQALCAGAHTTRALWT